MSRKDDSREPAPEFSRIVDCRRLSDTPRRLEIEADAPERRALTERFGLEAIDRLVADLTLARKAADTVMLKGSMSATVRQVCVVTLEPFDQDVEEEFVLYFVDEADRVERGEEELFLSPEDEELPEPMEDGTIDVGEAVAQQLSLALDPYPHAPGVEFEPVSAGEDGEEPQERPFEVLKKLTGGRTKN